MRSLFNNWINVGEKAKERFTIYGFPGLLLILLIILTAFRIHGASIARFNFVFFGEDHRDVNLLFGEPRPIRSDEYMLETPLILAQAQAGFATENPLFMSGQSLITIDVPVKNWVTLFRPQHWGFFILPIEQAYALKWWLIPFVLMIVTYYLFLKITKNNIFLSVLFSLSLFFSPFFQWWYSVSPHEVVTFGLMSLIFAIRLFDARRSVDYLITGLLLVFSVLCFAFALYPPWQITVFWFVFLYFLAFLLTRIKQLNRLQVRNISITIFLSLLVVGAAVFIFYQDNRDVIQAIQNSVYPGNRISAGGGLTIYKTLGGMFNIHLLDQKTTALFLGNQSEASSFFFISFFLLPVYVFLLYRSLIKKPVNWYVLFGLIYTIIIVAWGFGFLPESIGALLLLDRVLGIRVLIGLGVVNHFALVYFLTLNCGYERVSSRRKSFEVILYSIGVVILMYFLGLDLMNKDSQYLRNTAEVILVAIETGLLVLLILLGKKEIFAIGFFVISLGSTLTVNPLYRGLSPIIESDFSEELELSSNSEQGGNWVFYESGILENYLSANGKRALNGTYVVPNNDFWKQFDPDDQNQDIYNRYAHVFVTSIEDKEEIVFVQESPDLFTLHVNPCNRVLDQNDVNNFVFREPQNFDCLEFRSIVDYPEMPLYIYNRK